MKLFAALPMYDWPEERDTLDQLWKNIHARLQCFGIDAAEHLVRRNDQLPPVPGGIRDNFGTQIAPDPATLPPDMLDLDVLWRHPALLLADTCHGPLGLGLDRHVRIVSQRDYTATLGGDGPFYRSAIVMRGDPHDHDMAPPRDATAQIPADILAARRIAINAASSLSGWIAVREDLAAIGHAPPPHIIRTGSHRASLQAVAEARADIAAIDCHSLALARRHDASLVGTLRIAGWTAQRPGLPFITARHIPQAYMQPLATALHGAVPCRTTP